MRPTPEHRFDAPPGYLNTASIGIPPAFVADAVSDSITRWRTGADAAPDFDEHVAQARAGFAALVGVPPEQVASGASVSQLVALVAGSIPDGTRVLTVSDDFTSVTFPFAAQAHRGITVTEIELEKLASTVDQADLIAVSLVQSATGAVLDTSVLREATSAAGVPVLLDVSQAAGWLPLSLDWADWVVGAAYKWLLSPRGAAWLAVRPDALERTRPLAANWYAGEDPWASIYGLPLRLASDARRLDLSPAWLAQVGAAAAIPWLAGLDLGAVRDHCLGLANAVRRGLELPEGGSAITSLALSTDQIGRLRAAGVRFSMRAGRARLSFHLYNTAADVDLVLDALT
ncbi:aminotransferase class V-fold PLP-dependent enzyme [Crossiella sp. CA-258035]|uniref:aminotransferase class V-fold PLP-dependent enzyme n=1 Tax=Crossiella sp. CA-258035 TaxID=2981138 RepID=UPI0024BC5CCC|nr:aminotransferase class V-fold PLP-dependent enzyme [Crossiella sp. CA-258035]WHT17933.1 aminotransferase class V-fold PLP-dependent enzyme [Crossiella sp. CA-258035]